MKKQNSFHAQLSIEFLLVLAITLSFIILWLPAIIATKNSTQSAINEFYVKKAAEDIAYISDIICILGAGNEREIAIITDNKITITSLSNSKGILVFDKTNNISKNTKCNINVSLILEKGRTTFILKNEKEVISVK